MFEEYIIGSRGDIPWVAAAELHQELRVAPAAPVLTKEASAGVLKIGRIMKVAKSPEEAAEALKRQAMTDPDVMAALEHQELLAERAAVQDTIQELQAQVLEAQQAAATSDQQVQDTSMQLQEQAGALEEANTARQVAQQQALTATDQAMTEQVTQQQNRQQLMAAADQLALQLKQVAAQPTASEQQTMAAQEQEQQAAVQEQAAEVPPSAETAKEEKEAVNAQDEAQRQTAQAQQSKQQDVAKVQVTMPKQGSDRVAKAAALIKEARLGKEAKVPLQALYAGGGAALGAGKAGLEQAIHRKRYGKDQPTDKEVRLVGDLKAAEIKANRSPTYLNKMRVKQLQYRIGMEQAGREHPAGAVVRGALQGAVVGAAAAPAIHSLGKRGLTYAKAMGK
jgi:hypothetical protein